MTALGCLLGLGGAIAAGAWPAWRWPLWGAAAAGLALALTFAHRPEAPRRDRYFAYASAVAAVAASALFMR